MVPTLIAVEATAETEAPQASRQFVVTDKATDRDRCLDRKAELVRLRDALAKAALQSVETAVALMLGKIGAVD